MPSLRHALIAGLVALLCTGTSGCTETPLASSSSPDPVQAEARNVSASSGGAPQDSISARIHRHRTSPLRIRVLDADGTPLRGMQVHVQQLRHAYRFGTAVNTETFFGTDDTLPADRALYRQTIRSLFNAAVFEGGMKWKAWSNPDRRRRTLTLLEWLRTNNLTVRGHALVWGGWNHTPAPLREKMQTSPDTLRQTVHDHLESILPVIGDRVAVWDVVNEPVYDDDYTDRLGEQTLDRWFDQTQALVPNVKRYINEARILRGDAEGPNVRLRTYRSLIQQLQARGVPLDGIGMQGHMLEDDIDLPADTVYAVLDRFAETGLPIAITEFDIRPMDEHAEARLLRRVLRTAYSHPATNEFTMWGFWDGRHWQDNAPLFREDWSLKPSGQVWMDLVYDAWWTDAHAETGADGTVRIRATHGTHQLSIRRPDGSMQTREVTVPTEGAVVDVRLAPLSTP